MPVAVVTGASEGLGRAVAVELARAGWDLVIDGRRAGPLAEAADTVRGAGEGAVTVLAVPGDVTDPAHRAALREAVGSIGRLDLLVANAGALGPTPLPRLASVDLDAVAETLRVNVVAQIGLVQTMLPLLVASRGTFVAVTSDAAVEAYEGWGVYGASKAALEQMAHVLAEEQPDLRVYRFDPGDMRTQMHQDAFPDEDISDRPLPDVVAPRLLALVTSLPPNGRYRASDVDDLVGSRA